MMRSHYTNGRIDDELGYDMIRPFHQDRTMQGQLYINEWTSQSAANNGHIAACNKVPQKWPVEPDIVCMCMCVSVCVYCWYCGIGGDVEDDGVEVSMVS